MNWNERLDYWGAPGMVAGAPSAPGVQQPADARPALPEGFDPTSAINRHLYNVPDPNKPKQPAPTNPQPQGPDPTAQYLMQLEQLRRMYSMNNDPYFGTNGTGAPWAGPMTQNREQFR